MTEAEFVAACFKNKKWSQTVLTEARERISKGEDPDDVYTNILTRKDMPRTGPWAK